jgi:hypothetical protein
MPAKKRKPRAPAPAPTYEPRWGDDGPTDEQVATAMRVLRGDYWTSVRSLARDLARRVRAGELTDDTLTDAIHEAVDGSAWCIYTLNSQHAVLASDHDPAEDAADEGVTYTTDAQRAYACLRHDVTAQVQAELDGAS